MARYTGPRVRVSRRIGFNVFENRKGDKALQDRPYPPGENGRKRSRETDYGTQLKEKQKVVLIGMGQKFELWSEKNWKIKESGKEIKGERIDIELPEEVRRIPF